MKKFTIFILCLGLLFPFFASGQGSRDNPYTVDEVYTDSGIETGDTVEVLGYYTNPDIDILINFYGTYFLDEVYPAQSVLKLTGVVPPVLAYNGGFILVEGVVTFEPRTDNYYPEDTVLAYLEALEITVILEGEVVPESPGKEQKEEKYDGDEDKYQGSRNGCDPCKFAILISGGADSLNNHSKYWENLVALYKFKVDSLGYCDSNVFVHYFKGDRRDARIPSGRVVAADSAKIDSTHQLVANRVAHCTNNGMAATFQKMITNHGAPDGINLLGDEILKPDHLKDIQQPIIDSCCSTVYDEFLQCYGGNTVDGVSSMDEKSKATIYINSNANNTTGVSPHGEVHPYLQAKINTLDTGGTYDRAVVNAKLAYDDFVQELIDDAIDELNAWIASPPDTPERAVQIGLWSDWIAELNAKICKSRNVTIVPFTEWCQWRKFVVPPGGQLVVNFSGSDDDCGNASVYRENPVSGEKTRVKVWNWNHPGSQRYEPGNENRVINGEITGPTTFWIHNDNDTSRLRVEVLGSQVLPESVSNGIDYPGFSCGGTDLSSQEFGNITAPFHEVIQIEIVELSLTSVPSWMGPVGVQNFQFGFQINPFDVFWTDMALMIHVLQVDNPGNLVIQSRFGSGPPIINLPIPGPGIYEVPLGDFTLGGLTYGNVMLSPQPPLQFCFDSFGMRSQIPTTAHTTVWFGELSSDWNDPLNWSDGLPGQNSSVIITPGGFQPVITSDVLVKEVELLSGATINAAPGANVIVTGQE